MLGQFNHPRTVLLGGIRALGALPVCDHYCGTETTIRKSLALQNELAAEYGRCVMDVTLDCEDGAPVGAEVDHAQMVAEIARSVVDGVVDGALGMRVAVRVHPVGHFAFEQDIALLFGAYRDRPRAFCHVMLPKVESVSDVQAVCDALAAVGEHDIPVHCLIESPLAVSRASQIASHPRVQSLSFGLMDFVSSHGGAIGQAAMAYPGQFQHPLVVRAKLEIASACHAHAKVPSHCVVTEFKNHDIVRAAATVAFKDYGYTRMWSIHPGQVRPILTAFTPDLRELEHAIQVIRAAIASNWGPVSVNQTLHDRASFRYFWLQIERAYALGVPMDSDITNLLSPTSPGDCA